MITVSPLRIEGGQFSRISAGRGEGTLDGGNTVPATTAIIVPPSLSGWCGFSGDHSTIVILVYVKWSIKVNKLNTIYMENLVKVCTVSRLDDMKHL